MIEMKSEGTISSVVEDNLCTGCGTCVALCPNEAIEMVIDEKKGIYVPELDGRKCNNCGICFKVCPGHEVDFKGLNLEIFGKEPEEILIGNYLNCYIGHATDHDIRYNSASGGLVTALLIFALEEGLIDGALVTGMKKDKPLEPDPFIARTREEIIGARGSKYCPVPANVALKEILEADEGERFAVVGLPCHVHGLRKAQRVNAKLRERVVVCFGIFCARTDSFLATEFILNWFGIKKKNVSRVEYRGRGWPGSMLVELNNGDVKVIPFNEYIIVHELFMFTPARCRMCRDGLCELADISLGDAWGIELNDEKGTSLWISRTDIGETIMRKSIHADVSELEEIGKDTMIGSQGLLSNSRIRHTKANMGLVKLFDKAFPDYNAKCFSDNLFNPRYIDYAKFILLGIHRKLISKKILWKFIYFILPLERKVVRKIFFK